MREDRPILLVEDDQIDVMTVKRAITELGLPNPLKVASNGLEAMEYLKALNENPCIILLDLNMPRMSGIEFLQELNKNKNLRKFPVVVLTTSNEEIDILNSFKLGVAGYMVKPIDYTQFLETLEKIDAYWSTSLIPE